MTRNVGFRSGRIDAEHAVELQRDRERLLLLRNRRRLAEHELARRRVFLFLTCVSAVTMLCLAVFGDPTSTASAGVIASGFGWASRPSEVSDEDAR